MTIVTLDSSNLEAVMADAGMEIESPKAEAEAKPEAKPDVKPEVKARTEEAAAETEDDADDVEDDDGTSARQKRELSAKMLKAIGKKHRQVKEAEEFAADQIRLRREAETRAADFERQAKESKPREAVKEAVEPRREDFTSDADFLKASIKWGVDQGIAQREAARQEFELNALVEHRFKAAMSTVPDFQRVIEAHPLNFPDHMRAYVRESELSAEICYHYAKNPEAFEKVLALHPVKQLVQLGKVEATLRPFGSSESSPKEGGDKPSNGKATQAAPSTQDTGFSPSKARSDAPVIKPLTNSDGAQVEVDPRDMDVKQMISDFQKTKQVNLSARKRH